MNQPSKFRKKPVVIEALQYLGTPQSRHDVKQFVGPDNVTVMADTDIFLLIRTGNGFVGAMPNDWVVRHPLKDIHILKPDIFEATYETWEEHVSKCGGE